MLGIGNNSDWKELEDVRKRSKKLDEVKFTIKVLRKNKPENLTEIIDFLEGKIREVIKGVSI